MTTNWLPDQRTPEEIAAQKAYWEAPENDRRVPGRTYLRIPERRHNALAPLPKSKADISEICSPALGIAVALAISLIFWGLLIYEVLR